MTTVKTATRVALVRAEWTKLTSTPFLALTAALAVGLSLLVTALLGAAMGSREAYCAVNECVQGTLRPHETVVTAGVLGDGMPGAGLSVLMLLGAMSLLVEHRTRTLSTSFMVVPRRERVVLTKAAVVSVVAFVLGLATMVLSGLAFNNLGGLAASHIDPLSGELWGIYLRTALVLGVAAVFGLAVAALTWSMVVTVATVLLWPLFMELLIPAALPQLGAELAALMPFANARHFVGMQDGLDFPWGPLGSGVYFLVVVLVLFAAGTVVTARRAAAR